MHFRYCKLTLVASAMLLSITPALAANIEIVTDSPVGSNYDALDDTTASHGCVAISNDRRESQIPARLRTNDWQPTDGGYYQRFTFDFVTTAEDLFNSLNISASARVGSGTFGGSGSFNYVSKHGVTKRYTYLVVSNEIAKGPEYPRVDLPKNFVEEAERDPFAFYARCGTHYLSASALSASFRAIVEIQYEDETESTDIQAALSAKWSGGSASSRAESAFRHAFSQNRIHADIVDRGPLIETVPNPQDIAGVIDYARNFGKFIREQEKAGQKVWIQHYAIAESYRAFAPKAKNMRTELLFIEDLGNRITNEKSDLDDLELVIRDPDGFGLTLSPQDRSAVAMAAKKLSSHLIALRRAAALCVDSPRDNCKDTQETGTPPEIPDFDFAHWIKLPTLGSKTLPLPANTAVKLLIAGTYVCTGQGPGYVPCAGGSHISGGDAFSVGTKNNRSRYDPNRVYSGPDTLNVASDWTDERYATDDDDRVRLTILHAQ